MLAFCKEAHLVSVFLKIAAAATPSSTMCTTQTSLVQFNYTLVTQILNSENVLNCKITNFSLFQTDSDVPLYIKLMLS